METHPNDVDLYGGVSGVSIGMPVLELSDGVSLKATYAHIMAPYLMAFKRPPPGGTHPAPWKAASGGLGFDVTLEIFIPKAIRPTNFTRLNTIWWIASLMRLFQPSGLRVPVISSQSFSAIIESSEEPTFWPVEMAPRKWIFDTASDPVLSFETLEWIKKHWQSASTLMDVPAFNVAFQAFDQASWSYPIGSALLQLWSSIEALFRPGSRDIGRTLSKCVASYLEAPGPKRDGLFTRTRDLYQRRGFTAHAAEPPDAETAIHTFELARRCFIRAFQDCKLPSAKMLMDSWTKKTKAP